MKESDVYQTFFNRNPLGRVEFHYLYYFNRREKTEGESLPLSRVFYIESLCYLCWILVSRRF